MTVDMEIKFDINKLAAEFINSNIDRIFDAVGSTLQGSKKVLRSNFKRTYKGYLTQSLERYSKTKSFFIRSEPTPLYDFFVCPDLSNSKRTLEKPGVEAIADVNSSVVVMGTGGSGKTMLMRHLFVNAIVSKQKTPVFVELRRLNQDQQDIRKEILHQLQLNGLAVDDAYLELALKKGHFCLLFDGFDELNLELRENVAKQIQVLSQLYSKNWIIVSSRPDTNLDGWDTFATLKVKPLDIDRAVELIGKLPFDEVIKEKFIDAMQKGLFQKHESFLSNPLLVSIMLLTYRDNAHIPSKLSLFYTQAYEALFQRHDALKGGFRRERRTDLDIQEFEKVFSTFCLRSYDKREFSFSRTRALELLDNSKKLSQIHFDSSAYLDDTIQAVSLLVEDGLEITFSHRTFQEYFVAKFIATSVPEIKEQLVQRYIPKKVMQQDTVIRLLYEIDKYAVEKYYILPRISNIAKAIGLKNKVGITHYLRYIKRLGKRFGIYTSDDKEDLRMSINDESLYVFARFMQNICEKDLSSTMPSSMTYYEETRKVFKTEFGENEVFTSSLKTVSPFLRKMSEIPDAQNIRSKKFLHFIFDLANNIEKRHQEASISLQEILG